MNSRWKARSILLTDRRISCMMPETGEFKMLPSVKGVYRNGRVELIEPPPEGSDGDVIVTFLESRSVNLADRGIDEPHAADLRHRLAAFVEDWERPEMDAYDAPEPR